MTLRRFALAVKPGIQLIVYLQRCGRNAFYVSGDPQRIAGDPNSTLFDVHTFDCDNTKPLIRVFVSSLEEKR